VNETGAPFKQIPVFALKPPVFLLQHPRGIFVKYNVKKEALDLTYEQREIADTGSLYEIAFKTAITVGW